MRVGDLVLAPVFDEIDVNMKKYSWEGFPGIITETNLGTPELDDSYVRVLIAGKFYTFHKDTLSLWKS